MTRLGCLSESLSKMLVHPLIASSGVAYNFSKMVSEPKDRVGVKYRYSSIPHKKYGE